MQVIIQRYNPETDTEPYDQTYDIDEQWRAPGIKLLALLNHLQEQDPTLGYRHSCGEGVCGSDGMNVNGENGLSCLTLVSSLNLPIVIKPLPGLPIIRDLIVDMELFYQQFKAVQPYVTPADDHSTTQTQQTPAQRQPINDHYECILCGCCTTACPSFWWNPDRFHGSAALLAAERFQLDNRDSKANQRLQALSQDPYGIYRCKNIQNCTSACPKGLNPAQAIQRLKHQLS